MATKKTKPAAKAAPAAPAAKGNKKKVTTDAEKAAKREARREALKNRPEGQRPNSKQIDIIDLGKGGKVINFGAPVRKMGTLITSVAVDAEGNVVSTAVAIVAGVSPKVKKGHGSLVPKVPGMGKKAKGASAAPDTDEDDTDEDDED